MAATARDAWKLLRQTMSDWSEDHVPRLGAALAFYTALSIAPLLVISLRVAASIFGDDAARGELDNQIQSLVGDQGGEAIQAMLENANKSQSGGTVATVLSVVMLLFGASGVFGELQGSLNTIWEVQPKPGRGVGGFLRDRFLSMTMVMGVAFLLIVSLMVSAGLAFVGANAVHWPESLKVISQIVNLLVSLAVFTAVFAMMFKFLPDVKIAWKDVWLGAAITAILFTIGKSAIGLYLGRSSMASSYGVAGSLVVLLVWVYYSAQIVFFGAEFTQVYANRFGKKIVPSENAEPMTQEGRAQQGLTSHAETPAAVLRYFDSWQSRDPLLITSAIGTDTVVFDGDSVAIQGADVLSFAEQLVKAFPDVACRIVSAVDGSNGETAVRYVMTGTHQGPFDGLAATGREIQASGCDVFKMKDGRIDQIHSTLVSVLRNQILQTRPQTLQR